MFAGRGVRLGDQREDGLVLALGDRDLDRPLDAVRQQRQRHVDGRREPFVALDSQTRRSMQKLLLRVWEHSHKTVAFVTHDIDEAILLGDRVLVMTARPGRIKADIPIAIPRPRDPEITLEPEFIALKRQIIDQLRDEIDEGH